MAYITAAETKKIRNNLKTTFPNIKFSVKTENHSTVSVSILKSDIDFSEALEGREYVNVNTYYEATKYSDKLNELFNSIVAIMKGNDWYDKSDSMSDYFDTAYYMNLSVGSWDKPYELVA